MPGSLIESTAPPAPRREGSAGDQRILDVPGIRIPRPEILVNAFVLKPLCDIAAERLHPESGQSYAELWQAMAPGAPPMSVFPMAW